MKTTTLKLKHSVNRSPFRLGLLLLPLALACFALSPQAQADCREGCDANSFSTFLGEDALLNSLGFANTAVGSGALRENNSTGQSNTAVGSGALTSNTGGVVNTAVGSGALSSNTVGGNNTAVGIVALADNTTGGGNTAMGGVALANNTTGDGNTAMGGGALYSNRTGNFNTATGDDALTYNLTGSNNLAIGFNALYGNTTGNNNIALGYQAGQSLSTGDNNIDIGNVGMSGESNTIRIGTEGTHTATYIAGISGTPLVHGAAVAVGITADGQLGVRASSERFKKDIAAMGKTSEAILSLKPVTFRYKHEFDPEGIPQFGLVAEDVEKVNPDLVARDEQGKPYSVRYEAVNAMLLNEFLKEHRKVETLEATVAQQHKDFETVVAELKGQIQKVSAQLELSKSATQTVLNNN
jgi:hypothetical protein